MMKFLLIMVKLLLFLSLGFVSLYSYTLNPRTEVDRKVDKYFFQAIKEAKDLKYLKALSTTRQISELLPEHPAGYLYSAAVLSWIISDFYSFEYADEFLNEVNKSIDLSKDFINHNRKNPWGYVYLGGGYGFRGIYYANIGNFYSAFIDGVRGNFELNKAIVLDPGIYDNYFGTGTFDFWKAFYSGKFFWLSGSKKGKQKGIDKINLAINHGKYTTLEAEFSLVRIYLMDERYDDAIEKAEKMIIVSPNSVKARRFMGLAYLGKGDYQSALNVFSELREIIGNHKLQTPAALLETDMYIVKSYLGFDKTFKALSVLEESYKHYEVIDPENNFLKNLLEEYEDLEEDLQKSIALSN